MRRLALALMLLAAAPAQAQSAGTGTADAARAAAARLSAAGERLSETGGASARIEALTETVRAYEEGLAALREGLRRVAIRRQSIEANLDAQETDLSALLGALVAMERAPAPTLLLHPNGPLATARGALLVAEAAPALQDRVAGLRAELVELDELKALQDSAIETLSEGLDGAQQARAALAEAASDRTDLPQRFTEDPVRTALLVASTETLEAFASGLAQTVDRELAAATPDAAERKGSLRLPVEGAVVEDSTPDRPGIVIATPPRALVTAPVAATVRFRGPLLDYGNVLILEPAPDVLFVLAGLAETFGEAGQILPEGAALGLMGGETPSVDAILSESRTGSGANRPETLYLEVREAARPVDPGLWFDLGRD